MQVPGVLRKSGEEQIDVMCQPMEDKVVTSKERMVRGTEPEQMMLVISLHLRPLISMREDYRYRNQPPRRLSQRDGEHFVCCDTGSAYMFVSKLPLQGSKFVYNVRVRH